MPTLICQVVNPLGARAGTVEDYYQQNAGIRFLIDYHNQRYKTGQEPLITQNRLVVFNRTQLAAASLAPTADPLGPLSPASISSTVNDPPGLQDRVDIAVFAKSSGLVRLSGVGPQQYRMVSAGFSEITFFGVQAGQASRRADGAGPSRVSGAGTPHREHRSAV